MNARPPTLEENDISLPHLHSDARRTIPKELQSIQQWITWKYGTADPATGKRRKLPVGKGGTGSAWQTAAQWMDFDEAIAQAQNRRHCGVGLVLPAVVSNGQHLVATDHDKVGSLDADPGMNKRIAEIKELFKSLGKPYMEITPSGEGLRMLVTSKVLLAQISSSPNPLGGADELFCASSRWITVTGVKMAGDGLPDATPAIGKIADQWQKRLDAAKAPKASAEAITTAGNNHTPLAECDFFLHGVPPLTRSDGSLAAALAGSANWAIEPAAEGGRNSALCSLLGHAYAKGHTPDTFRTTATEWNSRCQPPMDTDEVERTLLSMWKTHLSHHPEAGVAAARREAQRKENAEIGTGEQFCPQPEVLKTEDMLGRFIFLSDGSRVFDTKYPKHVLSLADFRNTFAASCSSVPTGAFSTTGAAKTKSVPNFKAWLDSPKRLSAHSTTFDASASVYAKDPNGKHCVNMWTGFDRSIDPGAADVSFILEQIRWLFKDRANDFLDWLAHIEQHPGVLPHTMWLHISSYTGTGRNAIARLLSRVFSGYAAMSLDLERVLDSGFNDELTSKVLAVVDEIRIGGKDQWRHSETLKQMITAQVRHINVKYGRKSVEANACRFLVFSNHRNALPIDDNDRRIEVVISDARPKDAAHYSKLYRDVDDIKVVAAFAQFLRERDLSLFTPGRHALKNADKAQVVAVTGSDEYSALMEFTEIYTPPLVTADRLARVAGFSFFSRDALRFKHAVMDAGWGKVGRPSVKGKRVVIYAKKETVAQWINKKNEFLSGLPECDGGTVIWDEKND